MCEVTLTADVMAELARPFAADAVQWKPQATSRDGKKALAVAYVDVRAYLDRLNEVAGAAWSDDYEVQAGGAVVVCRLTVGGVTRADVGEAPTGDENTATSALAQAFKRACVKFGLGSYLYRLPKTWVAYDSERKTFAPAALAQLQRVAGNGHNGAGNGNGGELARAFPRYGDGSAVSDNAAELEAYSAHVDAKGQAPGSLAELRAWAKAGK